MSQGKQAANATLIYQLQVETINSVWHLLGRAQSKVDFPQSTFHKQREAGFHVSMPTSVDGKRRIREGSVFCLGGINFFFFFYWIQHKISALVFGLHSYNLQQWVVRHKVVVISNLLEAEVDIKVDEEHPSYLWVTADRKTSDKRHKLSHIQEAPWHILPSLPPSSCHFLSDLSSPTRWCAWTPCLSWIQLAWWGASSRATWR